VILLPLVLNVEETEFQNHGVNVQLDTLKIIMNTVMNVVSDVTLVSLNIIVVLNVLLTELMNQLVTVHMELTILMKPNVHHVTLNYVLLVLKPQITVSLVPVI